MTSSWQFTSRSRASSEGSRGAAAERCSEDISRKVRDIVPTAYHVAYEEEVGRHRRGGTGLLSELEPRRHHVRTYVSCAENLVSAAFPSEG